MVSIHSARPTMQVEVDGEVRELPISFNATETAAIGDLMDGDGNIPRARMATVFTDFARAYLGDAVLECTIEELSGLMGEWNRRREDLRNQGEPGES